MLLSVASEFNPDGRTKHASVARMSKKLQPLRLLGSRLRRRLLQLQRPLESKRGKKLLRLLL